MNRARVKLMTKRRYKGRSETKERKKTRKRRKDPSPRRKVKMQEKEEN